MEPVIHLRSAVAVLGRFPALAGVDLDVAPGETVLVQGPNGAGKTTLLRACAGLVPVTAGRAEVLGCDLRRQRREVRRRVGYLGHATGLYEELTVADNVRFWTRAAGADGPEAADAARRMGVHGRLWDVAVGRLSAGQRRRVAIAILLARRPELWLLDEPHAGLDALTRDLVDGLITSAAAAGATVVLASHELDRAHVVAARSVTIVGGMVSGPDAGADDASADPEAATGPAGSPGSPGSTASPPGGLRVP